MTAHKPTKTATLRLLALTCAVGALAACDYASKLPDAPATLGYELSANKPPSVTAEGTEGGAGTGDELIYLDPPRELAAVDTQQVHSVPLPPAGGAGLSLPDLDAPLRAPGTLSAGMGAPQPVIPELYPQTASLPPITPGIVDSGQARGTSLGNPEFPVSSFDPAPSYAAPAPSYAPPAPEFGGAYQVFEPIPSQPATPLESYEIAAAPAFSVPESTRPEYASPPLAAPLSVPQSRGPAVPEGLPVAVIRTRMPSGAVVEVHPVVGAPIAASNLLARTIATEIGSPMSGNENVANAPAVFQLRSTANVGGNQGSASADWQLFDTAGSMVGIFAESQAGGNWASLDESSIRAIGRRVADRLRRNSDLRRATLNAVSMAPIPYEPSFVTAPTYEPVALPSAPAAPRRTVRASTSAPAYAPMPQRHPVRMTAARPVQPVRTAPARPAPQPVQQAAPRLAPQAPMRRPEPVRTASLAPTNPRAQPAPIRAAPAPTLAPTQPVRQAPPPQPVRQAAPPPPPPSFDTLRPADQTASLDGPRSIVFRGVQGAPGDGNQALSREMSRVLSQSDARVGQPDAPGAVYLVGEVSRERAGQADRIKITWRVQDANGTSVGQVVQENEVPAGALDGGWGEDAYFATQGARDGILELLQEAGALG